MGIIKQLPEDVAIKIAAGEVVERPASVIKELVENAFDAGATKIEIALKDGGKTTITIKDNGSGMDRDDASAAFLRHGTSKIKNIDDLYSVTTMGFRGEALAAIGASAEVELITTLHDTHEGTRVVIKHGEVESVKPHAPLLGTSITVSDLFSAMPARQKFLKSEATEWKNCLDVITKQMIAHPEVGFIVRHNDRLAYNVPSSQELPSRVAETWRLEQSKLVEVTAELPHAQLYGVVAKPEVAHEGKARQFLSINGHPVNDKLITKAVKDAFGTLLPPGMQPSFALSVMLHPGMVDVNIHPRKDEVRFVNSQEIFRFVLHGVSQAIESANLAFASVPNSLPMVTLKNLPAESATSSYHKESFSSPQEALVVREPTYTPTSSSKTHYPARHATFGHVPLSTYMEIQSPTALPEPILAFDQCYLITQHNDKLLLIDQHAAHERILYNKLWQEHETRQIARQTLLLPANLDLNEDERAVFEANRQAFEELGFGFSSTGESELYLLEVPQFAKRIDPAVYFHNLLKGLNEERPEPELKDFQHKLFATMACKAAIKAGDTISEAEKRQLLDDLLATPNRFTCPHGRPSHIEISSTELEKLFKRTGF